MRKIFKHILIILVSLFVLFNTLIAIQCYAFSHFEPITANVAKVNSKTEVSTWNKTKMLFTGIKIPRPVGSALPSKNYEDIEIKMDIDKSLYGWHIPTDSTKIGSVLMFHGYVDNKSSFLCEADFFLKKGCDVVMIDFMGSGNSYGNQTTMGYLEADNVYATYKYAVDSLHEKNILLYGFSMGAAATLKAQHDYNMTVAGIILLAPYATYEGTIATRVEHMGLPRQPFATFAAFWMGCLNGFDGFAANPIDYATKIEVPTLLMCGSHDPNIPIEETESIFDAISSPQKSIKFFENSAHESPLNSDADEWRAQINLFLEKYSSGQ